MSRSLPNLNLVPFDLKIERTLRQLRQVRRRLQFQNRDTLTRGGSFDSIIPFYTVDNTAHKEGTIYSSATVSEHSLSVTGDDGMSDDNNPRLTLRELQARDLAFQALHARYTELNSNFELKSSLINLLPKFNEGKAKDWYYTLPDDVVVNWALFKKKYLENGGTLGNKTPEEAWLLISDVAEANQHFKTRATTSKSLFEVSSSESFALAKALGEIASTLKEIRQGQQASSNVPRPSPPSQLETPPRVCEICACNSHYTDECPQLQDDNTLAATNPFPNRAPYHPSNQGQYGNSNNQGWRDNSNQRWNQPQQNQAYHNQQYHNPPHHNQQTYQNPLYQP
ncbi:hypothetical protein PIB30_033968 [Stylosanthes scabra]|uniref:Retrotransposon gag domain-containing protein n=1 Tax=Stylosanthes scabra TaxID=79078 RepID=A0ABU6RDJ3_9FABA|nr:hypothetical protein [Stylosanthes scabra]